MFNKNKAVGQLSELIALEWDIDAQTAKRIKLAAAFYDVGKQKIPKSILNKPGKLDKQEFEIMKTHTLIGVEMLSSIQGELGEMARVICRYHHEWHNPSLDGYWGVSSSNLPDYVSFVSISDVYLSLISKRPYNEAWTTETALEFIRKRAGTQFSHELADCFIALISYDSRVPAVFCLEVA